MGDPFSPSPAALILRDPTGRIRPKVIKLTVFSVSCRAPFGHRL